MRGKVSQLVQEMLEQGVVKHSSSLSASPIVLVAKKDSSTRFSVNYRKLNVVTKLNVHPLPQIDDSLLSIPQPSGKFARWGMVLQELDLCIEYRPEKMNSQADPVLLSPLDCANTETCALVAAVAVTEEDPMSEADHSPFDHDLSARQQNDESI